jgi:Amt family ammonium transporter
MNGEAPATAFPLLLLVPAAIAGLALINAGLCRSRNAAHAMVAAVCVTGVVALAWFATGFAFQSYPGGPSRVIIAGGRYWDFIGAERLLLRGVNFNEGRGALMAIFGMLAAAVAATIPLGSGGERWRLGASCASSAIFGGLTFPLFAHWAWGGGWLAGLGFTDYGGSGVIHAVGGMSALTTAWIVGPRRGKYTREGTPAAFPGHNTVLVLLGCFLGWMGWLALNSVGAMLFGGSAILAAVNTTLSAAAASLTAAGLTRLRFGKADASLTANGWTAGLVAAGAGCGAMRPAAAVLIGLVAGGLAILAIEILELRLFVDDPGGAVAVHGVAGLWGLIGFGVAGGSWMPQFTGAATIVGFVLPLTYGFNWALDRFYRQRTPVEAERHGLDLYELGAGAYPDFVSHREDSWPR